MNQKLKDKVVIITGASRGLGKQISLNCLREGMKVVLVDKILSSFFRDFKNNDILFFKIDVASSKSVKKIVNRTLKKLGKIDFLINNAGTGSHLAFVNDYNEEDFHKIINTNFKSVFLFCKECVGNMVKNKSGHIINISSIVAKTGLPYFSIYSASKGAINAFSKSLHQELKQFNIKVDVICPGSINTPFVDNIKVKGKLKNTPRIKKINRNKMLNAGDIANIILDIMKYPNDVFLGDVVIQSRDFQP